MSIFYQTDNGALIIKRCTVVPMDEEINSPEDIQATIARFGNRPGIIFVDNEVEVDFEACNFKELEVLENMSIEE